ncbi:hypothetical protein JHK84_045339 [Glycine max]|uniref:Uncharacterized protein n=2 Tax=Glycine subgen. Soja TaxID=1462606 RepID=A0A0R0FPV7_SOYBN|nr:hypothetical protein JHK86_045287 [Glycine max]KAG4952001.1 hypothetical protein JHK85_045868 [Glycine max]KAG5108432.1 hypothetical protein JHK84_045339 [Glycine max]KAH1151172.1 hypothetical protein GYH30_044910 [Glycine max]RZB60751.1 hypothetical protein D0Y65_043488 [Glycine soja]
MLCKRRTIWDEILIDQKEKSTSTGKDGQLGSSLCDLALNRLGSSLQYLRLHCLRRGFFSKGLNPLSMG